MGPSAIRYAGLEARLDALGYDSFDWGNVGTAVAEATTEGDSHARFLNEIKEACKHVAHRVAEAVRTGVVPVVLGGDHSVALGTLGGLASARGAGGVLWIDAHGDLNTPETSPSGNVHGMPLAAALGVAGDAFASDSWPLPALDPARVALIGVRSLDEGERELVHELGIFVATMTDLDRRGVEPLLREALEQVQGAPFVHGSLEVVEVNPILDRENATGRLAVELAASAFGARIL